MGEILVRSTGSFCSAAAKDDVQTFFAAHPVEAADVSVKHALEHIDGCIELRSAQGANLEKWLAEHARDVMSAWACVCAGPRTLLMQ